MGPELMELNHKLVIDEEALVRAMKASKVSRVGLDVFEHEPRVHPFLRETYRAALLPVRRLNLAADAMPNEIRPAEFRSIGAARQRELCVKNNLRRSAMSEHGSKRGNRLHL
jgi:hypothetical protein